jgi:hypothetical protein
MEGSDMADERHYAANTVEVTGFRVGRMVRESGAQLVYVEMATALGKTVPFVCSIELAIELAKQLRVEAKSPIQHGNA